MKYLINNHEIEFDRKAMTAAHQAFPLEFAEWNLALKMKGKALLPGVRVTEIGAACMTDADRGAKPIFGSERAAETTPSAPVPPAPPARRKMEGK